MSKRSLTTFGLLAVLILYVPVPSFGASGQVGLPLNHRLNGILVDLYRPGFIFGHEKVSRGFVATRDGLVLAPITGLEKVDLGGEIKLEWQDKRSAEGWLVWKDEEMGYVIVRLLDPMPLFPAVGSHPDALLRAGQKLYAPGQPKGGQPSLSEAVVAGIKDINLPSGRPVSRAILLTPSLGSGPLGGPLVDESGSLVGMVSNLPTPAGFDPGTVVALPIDTLQPDLRAARGMRPPRRYTSPPPVYARPSYRIGIGIGSGGVYPSLGVGFGGVGGTFGTSRRRRREPWVTREDPYLRNEQEATDRAKTEALEEALEQQSGMEPGGNPPLLTNTEPLPPGQASPGGPDSWRAGQSTVASKTGSGQVSELSPEAYDRQNPSIGSTWNPAGPPLTASPSQQQKSGAWPVVIEPKAATTERTQQQESDQAKTEELEKKLAQAGAEGSPGGGASHEFKVLASPSSSATGVEDPELAALRARNRALERELELLRQSVSETE